MSFDPTPMLTVYDRQTAALVDTVNGALATYRQDRSADGPSLAKVRNAWHPVPDQLAAIDETMATLRQNILNVTTDADLTPDARERRIQTLSDVGWVSIKTAIAAVDDAATVMLETARAAVYPARPEPQDAVQEARLAGIKSDAKMVLDTIAGEQATVDRIKLLLRRALDQGDALAAWLFAVSDWPADYLTSRGFDLYLTALAAEVDDVIADATPDTQALVALYRTLAHPREGLPVLGVLLGHLLEQVWADLRAWRPAANTRVPSTLNNGGGIEYQGAVHYPPMTY